MEPLTTLQAAQNITNRQGSQSRSAGQPPTSPTDEGVDTVWIYGSETFRRIVPGCRILFYSSHGGWQVGLVWQVKPDRHADPRRKRPLTWRVLADEIPPTNSPNVHQLNTGKVHWRLLQSPDTSALDFFGLTSFEDIIDGKYEHINMEASLGISARIDTERAAIPPIVTEAVEEEIHRIQDLQYLLSLPGCLPPHKRGELGATYAELVQAIQGDRHGDRQTSALTGPQVSTDLSSRLATPETSTTRDPLMLGLRQGGLSYQPGSVSGRQSERHSELSDEIELPDRELRRTGAMRQEHRPIEFNFQKSRRRAILQ
ncbi:hypothetical protein WJX74_005904 [Apatococcus lobatus]|uniref:Uncharacterized protein n=1 Tax=Apatococcus lobatus TaxID=904363 RepID=A0AAW1SAT3_9CHLO